MDKVEICKKIKKAIRYLILFDGKKIISSGTGIIVKNTGELLTANHVVKKYPTLPTPKIFADGVGNIPRTEYKPSLFNISLDINISEYAKPLEIDLAILEPTKEQDTFSFIGLDNNNAVEGEEIIMAGFPDEIRPPLNFDKMLNFDNPELKGKKEQIDIFFKYLMSLIMMKSGMIGSVQGVKLNSNKINISGFDKKEIDVDGAVYWIDNASTYGASGGPVVNSSGKLIGIICEKGLTEQLLVSEGPFVSTMKVPSGSTMALSHKLITCFLKDN